MTTIARMAVLSRRDLLACGLCAGTLASAANKVHAQTSPEEERLHTDWPDLGRYRRDNARLLASGEPVDIVFMGDSITEGWIAKMPDFFTRGRISRGISGQTTPQMLLRFRQDVIRLQPRAVHIMAGTNDIAGNTGPSTPEMTQDNFLSMAEIASANSVRLILASIPPAADFPWRPGLNTADPIMKLNAWLKEHAAKIGAIYADYHGAMSDGNGGMRPGLSYDHVHPSEEGYSVMRPVAEAAIAAGSAKPPRRQES
jgi:lysophospholipase L1-like esterase